MNRDELFSMMSDIEVIEDYIENIRADSFEDPDITPNEVLKECLRLLIVELRKVGIEFHCDESELLSNFHDAQIIIDLYKEFTPDNLSKGLVKESELYTAILNMATDDSPETLLNILEWFSENTDGEDFYPTDRFVFLKDKVNSTSLYNDELLLELGDIFKETVDPMKYMKFINKLNGQKEGLKRFFTELAVNDVMDLTKHEINYITNSFRSDLLQSNILTLILEAPPAFVEPLVRKCSNRDIRSSESTNTTIVKTILNIGADKQMFGIEPDEDTTIAKLPEFHQIYELAINNLPEDPYVDLITVDPEQSGDATE